MTEIEKWMDLAEEAGQLREALASRAPIEQAKGIIVMLCRTNLDGAFERLRAASSHLNVKLAVLSAAIVEVAVTPSPDFTRFREPTPEHVMAHELLEAWGMDFGHIPENRAKQPSRQQLTPPPSDHRSLGEVGA